ncbi:MAG: signal peptide peptidase SppA [Bacteroidetes bacterium]|nr:signal peptide peptidase SppA [Bacteroidota bacterium]
MSTTAKWVIGIFVGLIFLFGIIIFVMMSWMFSDEGDSSIGSVGDKLAVIELKEEIYFSEEIVRQFKKYRENSSVRAIVFRIESPGGGVAASQEIFEEVKKTRDAGKPVVVSMGSVAASGGYYVACAANKIVANPGTLTGSIGVISHFLSFEPLMKKVGVEETTIKTGKFKDIGSPFRKTTEEDKQYFNSVISDVYDQFVDAIEEERGLERAHILKYADGRVFTGRQAVEYGFVDTLGTMEDAVSIAAELGDIKGRPNVIKETKRKTFFERIIGDAAAEVTKIGHEFLRSPVLQYRFVSPD